MYNKLIRRATDFMLAHGSGVEEKREIYSYGLELILIYLINTITLLLLGLFFGCLLETLILLVSYALLQSFAGGYHAMTHLRCFLLTFFGWAATMLMLPVIVANRFLPGVLAAIGLIVIFIFSPVKHVNFPMSPEKEGKMRRIARTNTILLFMVVLSCCIWFPGAQTFAALLGLALFLSGVSMIFAVLKEMRTKNKTGQSGMGLDAIEKSPYGGNDGAREKVENNDCR